MNDNQISQLLDLLHRQASAMTRIARSVEVLEQLARSEAEQYDTTDSPPSDDLSGRPLSVR